jgi:two-component system OmpR family response regulator
MDKKKILIVDDDPRNIFALSATLRKKGFDCISCSSGGESLNILQGNEQIDAVLMDMMMPGMDGYEAIPLIRQIDKRKKTKIISVTAQAMVGDKEKCLNAGADAYISKPVNVDKLLEELSAL